MIVQQGARHGGLVGAAPGVGGPRGVLMVASRVAERTTRRGRRSFLDTLRNSLVAGGGGGGGAPVDTIATWGVDEPWYQQPGFPGDVYVRSQYPDRTTNLWVPYTDQTMVTHPRAGTLTYPAGLQIRKKYVDVFYSGGSNGNSTTRLREVETPNFDSGVLQYIVQPNDLDFPSDNGFPGNSGGEPFARFLLPSGSQQGAGMSTFGDGTQSPGEAILTVYHRYSPGPGFSGFPDDEPKFVEFVHDGAGTRTQVSTIASLTLSGSAKFFGVNPVSLGDRAQQPRGPAFSLGSSPQMCIASDGQIWNTGWHRITVALRFNTSVGARNGWWRIWVNGTRVVDCSAATAGVTPPGGCTAWCTLADVDDLVATSTWGTKDMTNILFIGVKHNPAPVVYHDFTRATYFTRV